MHFVFIPCDLDRSISHKISRYDRHLPITAHACWVNTSEGNSRIQFAGRTHTSSIASLRSTLRGRENAGYHPISLEGKFAYALVQSRLSSYAFVQDWM